MAHRHEGLAACALLLAAASISTPDAVRPVAEEGAAAPRGAELYARHCAACHGPEGRGDGDAAYLLSPAPRDFGSGRFRLVSTVAGAPTRDDIVSVLRRGMPGSAMPPWEWMPEEDLRSLADYVLDLAVEGQVADLRALAEEEGDEFDEREAREIALRRMAPGEPVAVGAPAPDDPATLDEGRRLYVKWCASCHGDDGSGTGVEEQWNEDGTPTSPRDFTAGIFKGGWDHASLVRRMLAGMPGSPMPQATFEDPSDAARVAAYVRSLVRPAAEQRVQQSRRRIRAVRVDGGVPRTAADALWREVPGHYLALMPLWWRDRRVEGVTLRALHDGSELALLLSWEDSSVEEELLGHETFSDAAALQLSADEDPPLFAMGEGGKPCEIALWKAAWARDRERARDVEDRYPHTMPDLRSEVPAEIERLFVTARAAGNGQSLAARAGPSETLRAEGFGTLAPLGASPGAWRASAAWKDGFWDAVFTRPLAPATDGEVALTPGTAVFVGLAVWDGGARDRDGQKSVTVWHELVIDP